jgi:signal transduction histidine kinase
MKSLANIFLEQSLTSLPLQYRTEFLQEVMCTSVRRGRVLLWIAMSSYLILIYFVNVRNVFHQSESGNQLTFAMHLALFLAKSLLLVLIYARPLRTARDVAPYHVRILFLSAFVIIAGTLGASYTILITKGHPIFYFLLVTIWYSTMLIPPRILVLLLAIMVSSFWTLLYFLLPSTSTNSYNGEAFVSSVSMVVFLMVSGTMLFRSYLQTFHQRKIVEEERNTIKTLNAEVLAFNKELAEQADIIKNINLQLEVQNQTLRENDAEKDALMEIVAHDLQNPIGTVRGFADLIQSNTVPAEDFAHFSKQIVKTTDRMLALVTNLLDISRLESGKMQFRMVQCNLSLLTTALVEDYHSVAMAKHITIHFRTDAAPLNIYADEMAMREVLDNILSNAVKYSPVGKNVFIRVKSSNEAVRVEVQDEGQGISEGDMKKLFGKFARLSTRPTGGEHSTGLGLSIVKKMVEAMNGRVWCESELGNGATFIVELPKVLNNC